MKKIIIGQFYHESNSFSPVVTDETEFGIIFGAEIDLSGDDSQNTIGAFGRKAEEYGWEAIPVVDGGGIPSGEIRQDIYESVKEGLLKGIRDNWPVDAVLLSLHGASLAQGYDDPDGDLLEAVRNEVGAEIPIIATLDKHANVSELMVNSADILLAFNREPHVDPYDRGLEAGDLLKKMFDGKINPVSIRVKPPVLLPAINGCTEAEPMMSIQNKLYELENTPGVIDVSMLIGFYGSDKADSGPCTIVTTDGDRKLAAKLAVELSEMIWEKRDDFFIDLVKPEEAIKRAKAEGGVWAFVDEADDPFGGSTGDNVTILRKLIENGVKSAAVSPIADAAAVAKAVEAGVGATVNVSIGGKAAPVYGGPIDVEAMVRKIWTDPIHMSEWDEELVPMGTIVVLDADGIDILLTEEKIGVESVNIFKEIGMDMNDYSILVIKGLGNTIRQVYGDSVKEYVEIDTAGCSTPDVTKLGDFKNLSPNCYPFNKDTEFKITVLKNGAIYTMDGNDTVAEAIVYVGDEIVYVGDNGTAEGFAGKYTEVVDLEGKMVVPGFIDAHNHCPGNAIVRGQIDLVHCEHSPEVYAERIKEYAEANREEPFHYGVGIRLIDFGDEGPDKSFLDGIVKDKPIILRDASGQYTFLNTAALEAAEITKDTKMPFGVTMQKAEDGEPTGLFLDATMFMDMGGLLAAFEKEPEMSTEESFIEEWAAYEQEALEKGITSIVNGLGFDSETRPIIERLRKECKLNLRSEWLCSALPGFPECPTAEETVEMMNEAQIFRSPWQSTRGVKLYIDGTPYGATSYMVDPYEAGTCMEDGYRGESCYTDEDLKEVVAKLDKAGYQVQGHCMGDGSVRQLVDAFEYAYEKNGRRDGRHTVIHANLIKDEEIRRMADMDIYAAMQVGWAWNDPFILRTTEYFIGAERAQSQYRVRDMLDAGITVVSSSDYTAGDSTGGWCPLAAIETGVTRSVTEKALKDDPKYILGPDQAVTVTDMLKLYTINGAKLMFMEKLIGSLEPGKKADMVILAEDLTKIDPKKISETKVCCTIMNGEIVYQAE